MLSISQKGFKAAGSLEGNVYELTRTTTYLDFPLLVTLKPISFITLLAGPNFSYLLNEKYAFGNASTTIEQEKDFINDEIRKSTLGFGGGLDINLNHFVLSGRVFLDLQKTTETKMPQPLATKIPGTRPLWDTGFIRDAVLYDVLWLIWRPENMLFVIR